MMSSTRTFLSDVKQRCLDCGGSRLWDLAVTHPSVARSGQLSLWRLGSTAIDLALTWNQLQAGLHRDSATLTRSLASLHSSTAWLDNLIEDGGSFFVMGKGLSAQSLSHQVKMQFVSSILGACFYLDEAIGLEVVRQHLWKFYPNPTEAISSNPKSELQQYAQAKHKCTPIYVVLKESGPDHDKLFCVSVSIPGRQLVAQGKGTTKKLAEKNAARAMLDALDIAPSAPNSAPIQKITENRGSVFSTHSLHSICDGSRRQPELREGVFQFIAFVKKRFGVDLKFELAEIVMAHSSLGSASGHVGPKATGLTLLGNLAYEYSFLLEILRSQQIEQLSGTDLPARMLSATQMLFNNLYKIRLADGWRSYIRTSSGTPRPLADSIVLDAFEGSIGAAVAVDFGALAEIRRCLRERVAGDVDLTDLSLEPTIHQDIAGAPRALLQQLSQFVHPGRTFILSELLLFEIIGPSDTSEVVCKVKGDLDGRLNSVAPRKKGAIAACSESILRLICSLVENSVDRQSGIGWIDSLVGSLCNSLFENPLEDAWRSAILQRLPFAEPTKQSVRLIGGALRHPPNPVSSLH